MSNILVIDTATEACSVALGVGSKVYSRFEVCPQQHSQRILPMVDDVLRDAKIELADLDCLAYGHGPGSFTGVRIASGIIQGLAIGTDLPVIGVSTMATMAQQALMVFGHSSVYVAIDARMNEVYFSKYKDDAGIMVVDGEESVIAPELAHQILPQKDTITAVGTGWKAYESLHRGLKLAQIDDIAYPNAEFMLPIAQNAWNNGQSVAVEDSQPVYLRDKVTWKKLPGR